jgi:hypothetical protein
MCLLQGPRTTPHEIARHSIRRAAAMARPASGGGRISLGGRRTLLPLTRRHECQLSSVSSVKCLTISSNIDQRSASSGTRINRSPTFRRRSGSRFDNNRIRRQEECDGSGLVRKHPPIRRPSCGRRSRAFVHASSCTLPQQSSAPNFERPFGWLSMGLTRRDVPSNPKLVSLVRGRLGCPPWIGLILTPGQA